MWEIIESLQTLSKFETNIRKKRPISFIAGVHDTVPIELLKEAKKCQTFVTFNPILGGKFTYDICLDSVRHYSNWDWTVPKCVINMLSTKKPIKRKTELTARQQQIYQLVSTRGMSNKTIARTLKISESTVKLHVSSILKKYGVRNRTQLAVFCKDQKSTTEVQI